MVSQPSLVAGSCRFCRIVHPTEGLDGRIHAKDRAHAPAASRQSDAVASRASLPASCIRAAFPYLIGMMKLTLVQDQAIQARVAGAVGAETFDRLFAGIRFDKLDGTMLYAFAKDEELASDIEDGYSIYIAAVASHVLKQQVDVVVVMPKVLQ